MYTENEYYFCTDCQVRYISVIAKDFIFLEDAVLDNCSPAGLTRVDSPQSSFAKENILRVLKGSVQISAEEALRIVSVN
jgi:hypothetical protein